MLLDSVLRPIVTTRSPRIGMNVDVHLLTFLLEILNPNLTTNQTLSKGMLWIPSSYKDPRSYAQRTRFFLPMNDTVESAICRA